MTSTFPQRHQSLLRSYKYRHTHTYHTYLVMADFYVLLHDDPGDRLCQRGCCQRPMVRPVVISVTRQQTGRVEPGELYHTALQTTTERHMHQTQHSAELPVGWIMNFMFCNRDEQSHCSNKCSDPNQWRTAASLHHRLTSHFIIFLGKHTAYQTILVISSALAPM